jgi:hypothetical protein
MSSRIDEIRERWANIPPMECGTSDTGAKCEAYLYEKDFPNTLIATMANLYDTGQLNALAKSKSDIDYLLSLIKDGGAEDSLYDSAQVAINSCKDVTTLKRFAASVDPVRWVEQLQAHLENAIKIHDIRNWQPDPRTWEAQHVEILCACRTFDVGPARAYLDGCEFLHTTMRCPPKKFTATAPTETSAHECRPCGYHAAVCCQCRRLLPSTTPTETSARCGKCGHNNFRPDLGYCIATGATKDCGCKCVFPAPTEPAGERWPTEEEAEEILREHGTSEKEVINGFIDQVLRERLRFEEAIKTFIRNRGKHEGEHVFDLTVCRFCDESYIQAESALDAVAAAHATPVAQPEVAPHGEMALEEEIAWRRERDVSMLASMKAQGEWIERLKGEVERLNVELTNALRRVGKFNDLNQTHAEQLTEARTKLATARAHAIGECVELVEAERLHENLDNDSDRGYQRAISHMIDALEQLKGEGSEG